MAVVVAFLTASQSAGLDSAAITVGLLGFSATLCRLAGAVVLAVCAGMAVPSCAAAPPTDAKESAANESDDDDTLDLRVIADLTGQGWTLEVNDDY